MAPGLTRRALITSAAMLGLAGAGDPPFLAELEARSGGRLGFALLDTADGHLRGHRLHERFGLCSTFKLPLAALVLQAAERGELALDELVPIAPGDPVQWSPVTRAHVGRSLSISELAEAAQKMSDNGAANLLMARLGGPKGVTKRLRRLGDEVTRIDRWEPEMNRVVPPDPRDTSSPAAFAQTLAKLLVGDGLAPVHQALLAGWMVDSKTGLRRLRAGAPPGWIVGDKTGSSWGNGTPNRTNDVALLRSPSSRRTAPLIVVAFHEASGAFPEARPADETLLAEAMRLAAAAWLV